MHGAIANTSVTEDASLMMGTAPSAIECPEAGKTSTHANPTSHVHLHGPGQRQRPRL